MDLNLNDISYLAGVVISLLSEEIPQIKRILDTYTPKQRFFGQLVIVALVVLAINTLSCYSIAQYNCIDWQIISNVIISWSIGQLVHWTKKGII